MAIADREVSPACNAVTTANCSAWMLALSGRPGSSMLTPRYTAPEAPNAAAPTRNCEVGERANFCASATNSGRSACTSTPRARVSTASSLASMTKFVAAAFSTVACTRLHQLGGLGGMNFTVPEFRWGGLLTVLRPSPSSALTGDK